VAETERRSDLDEEGEFSRVLRANEFPRGKDSRWKMTLRLFVSFFLLFSLFFFSKLQFALRAYRLGVMLFRASAGRGTDNILQIRSRCVMNASRYHGDVIIRAQ